MAASDKDNQTGARAFCNPGSLGIRGADRLAGPLRQASDDSEPSESSSASAAELDDHALAVRVGRSGMRPCTAMSTKKPPPTKMLELFTTMVSNVRYEEEHVLDFVSWTTGWCTLLEADLRSP
jgi:hypothetical protein